MYQTATWFEFIARRPRMIVLSLASSRLCARIDSAAAWRQAESSGCVNRTSCLQQKIGDVEVLCFYSLS